MKLLAIGLSLFGLLESAHASTTIDTVNKYSYAANLGWMDWRGDTNSGAVIGEYVCSGYVYAANVGWISLGSGAPTNGIYYQNLSASDCGVNHDGQGNLRGFAWGANIGWINFENIGAPKVDLKTGRINGYIYSANCGWIGLSNSFAQVQTVTIASGLMDTNGLPIAWELQNFSTQGVDPLADPDHDGMSNKEEYLAGTNPNDTNDKLAITSVSAITSGGGTLNVAWKSVPTREYYIQTKTNLASAWSDSGLGLIASDGAFTTRTLSDLAATAGFYRVHVVKPLAP